MIRQCSFFFAPYHLDETRVDDHQKCTHKGVICKSSAFDILVHSYKLAAVARRSWPQLVCCSSAGAFKTTYTQDASGYIQELDVNFVSSLTVAYESSRNIRPLSQLSHTC
jgi:hypothetical protein